MVCLEPLTPDEFAHWYRHLGRLRLFWAKPVVEFFPLYRLIEGCVVKVRWSSERPRLEEAHLIILRRAKKLDFVTTLRGTKILITPEEIERSLYQARGALYIYSTSRPCASALYLEKPPDSHPEPGPDHLLLYSGPDMKYILYLNKWNFNIDYLWLSSPDYLDRAVESAICEARRLGGRYVTIATGGGYLASIDYNVYMPDYLYNTYKLSF